MHTAWQIFEDIDLLNTNKRHYVAKVISQGFIIKYRCKDDDSFVNLVFKVFYGEKEITTITFAFDNASEIHCQNATDLGPFKRKGIATSIYVLAEHLSGRIIWDYWGDKKTPDAVAFWAQKNRPFGNRPEDNSKTISLY